MKDEKKGLMPRLRFPEFRDAGVWDNFPLSKISERITEKVGSRKLTTVSITAGLGFVSQAEKFGRDISGDQYKNYILLKRGQFSYNKGNSKTFPQGCIYQLNEFDEVAAPNAFISFKFEGEFVPEFFKGYFDSNFHGYQLLRFITSGARSDGLLNISPDDFFSIRLPTPKKKEEQQKIADCLSSLDALIAAQADKLDALKTHKKGLMQQLFPREGETVPRLRFPEFREAGEWEEKLLREVTTVLQGYGFPTAMQGKDDGKYPFCKVSDISRAVAEQGGLLADAANYVDDTDVSKLRAKLIPIGSTVFAKIGEALRLNRRAFVHRKCLIDNNVVGLKTMPGTADDYFIYLLSQLIDLNKHCGGAVPSVNKSTLEAIEVVLPGPEEQQKIADCLSSLDALIAAQAEKLETLKDHKKGLMQQLFPSPEAVSA